MRPIPRVARAFERGGACTALLVAARSRHTGQVVRSSPMASARAALRGFVTPGPRMIDEIECVTLVPDSYADAAIHPALQRLASILIGMALLEPVLLAWHVFTPDRASSARARSTAGGE